MLHLSIVLSLSWFTLSEQVEVIATTTPVTTTVGSDARLSFRLSPVINAETMEFKILRPPSALFVLYYRPNVEVFEGQMQEYRRRAKLEQNNLKMGEVSFIIHDVVTFDNGTYRCLLTKNGSNWTDLDLLVTALGSDPVIELTNPFNEGFRAHCKSEGWYPEPTILWKDIQGNALESLSQQKHKTLSGLFTIHSSVSVTSAGTVSCIIRNTFGTEERQVDLVISDTLYRKCLLCVGYRISVVLGIIALPVIFFLSYTLNRKLQGRLTVHQQELEELTLYEFEETIKSTGRFLTASKAGQMNLDANAAHNNIKVSEDKKRASLEMTDLQEPNKDCYVLSDETLPEGVCYIDFEVKNDFCIIGVCVLPSQGKKRKIIVKDENRFVVHINEHAELKLSSSNQEPCKLRMYVDRESQQMVIVRMDNRKYIVANFSKNHEEIFLFLAFKGTNVISLC